MKIVSKITLAAIFGLALAFTFSCSDDDKKGGDWLTCEEGRVLEDKCRSKYSAERDACKTEDCEDAVKAKQNKCIMDAICNGHSEEECRSHYKSCKGE